MPWGKTMTRSLSVWLVVTATSTFAQAKTVARIVSVEGPTFTIEVLEGGVSDTEALELWTPGGKKAVMMSVPGSGWVDRNTVRDGVSCKGGTPTPRAVLTKPGQVTSWAQAQAAVAAFPPKVVAKVVSLEGTTVTLTCVEGALTNGQALDLLTNEGATRVTVTLPSGIDLVLKGDTVKGITIAGGRAVTGAVVSDRARFGAVGEVGPWLGATAAPAPPVAAAPAFKPNPAACVFSQAELKAALGFDVEKGQGTETPFSTGTNLSCEYRAVKGFGTVWVNRTVMTSGSPTVNAAASRKMLAGRLEPVPNDPDGAGWQVDQGDLTHVTLHYWRGNTGTEVRVSGVDQKNAAAVAAMRRNVLSLRRP
ncbi:MAG: hypothetical protein SFW67_07130 [Myxococcaceae bacterium]|nr:hypothetical protein [Myxococcaceae bacterium]